jgi:hypothetical protein
MLPNLRSQVLGACGQINRRRLNVRVSHHLGERENVAPAFEHEGGKRQEADKRVAAVRGSVCQHRWLARDWVRACCKPGKRQD